MFQKASPADIAAVCALCERVKDALNANGIPQWDEVYPTKEIFERDIAEQTLYLLIEDNALLGIVVLNDFQDEEYGQIDWRHNCGKIGVIHRLMVDPAAQGQGAARKLLAFAQEEAARQGCGAIRLDAFSLNPRALRLYEQNGYDNRGTVQFRKGPFFCYEKKL